MALSTFANCPNKGNSRCYPLKLALAGSPLINSSKLHAVVRKMSGDFRLQFDEFLRVCALNILIEYFAQNTPRVFNAP